MAGAGGSGVVGSNLTVINGGAISGGLSGDGSTRANAIQFTGGNNTLTLLNRSILTGNVAIDGDGSVTFNQPDDQTLGNVITGNGSVIQDGAGTLILNGVNTYTGGTTINTGTLEIGDAATPTASILGNVQVNPGGTLRGHGTVGGAVNNTGTVWPGGSIGTLTVGGNYTQSPSGTLRINVSPIAASQLKVGGAATLGGSLNVLHGPGTYTARTYQIVSSGAVDGKFATVSGNLPDGFTQSLTYSSNAVMLELTGVIAPPNATIFGAIGSATLREAQRVNGALLDRLGRACLSSADTGCTRPDQRLWIQANGTFTHVDGNHGVPDVRDDRYGFLAGADRQWKGWTVGLAAGYSHGDVRENAGDASGKIDTLRLAAYAGKRLGPVNIAGTLGYAYDFLSTIRSFGPFGNTKGSGHDQEFNAGVQAGMPWSVGPIVLTPHLGVRYAHINGLAASKSGLASQGLSVDWQSLDSLQPYVGLTLDYPFQLSSERSGSFQARVGYAYETQNVNRTVLLTAADGTSFAVPGTVDSRGMVTTGLGFVLPIGKTAKATIRYDALLRTGNVSAQSVQVGVSYRF
ncbi:MAG: autotransporter domain-containing protein [Burkholderiaceae bacterium]|nr:MAG: autotransporter domain-containing protein [Burkholderiaceae bacterium]